MTYLEGCCTVLSRGAVYQLYKPLQTFPSLQLSRLEEEHDPELMIFIVLDKL